MNINVKVAELINQRHVSHTVAYEFLMKKISHDEIVCSQFLMCR